MSNMDMDVEPGNCTPDNSTGGPSAIPITSGMGATGQICPRGDSDWYVIAAPAGQTLLDVAADFPQGSVTKVNLAVQLYQADGTTAVANGSLLAPKGKASVSSTLLAATPGMYVLSIRDQMDSNVDNLNSYVLTATTAMDPDTHEPNDTVSTAKAADMNPAWFSYQGDVDYYTVTVPAGSSLVKLDLENPATTNELIHYHLADAMGNTVVDGDAPPTAMMYSAVRSVSGPGDYVIGLSAPTSAPDRTAANGYKVMLTSLPELDPHDMPGMRNDTGANATSLGGQVFTGGNAIGFAQTGGQVGSLGDRDFFRFEMGAGASAAGIVEMSSSISSTIQLAMDLLTPEPNSPCTTDSDCASINVQCMDDTDCELSHTCLPSGMYKFCPMANQPCRLCVGAGACVPASQGGPLVCAAPQYLSHSAMPGGSQTLSTAQPLFSPGSYYVVVHDYGDARFDYNVNYTLNVSIKTEPDVNDRALAARNNFYNPYPMQMDNLSPNKSRAIPIDGPLLAGTPITGFISYQTDEDWYVFDHPCPGLDCHLLFNWTNPGPSPVKMFFFVREDNTDTIHESWSYSGPSPTTSPVSDVFGDGDCHECSFAAKGYAGKYYVQVRSKGDTDWDSSNNGQYSFSLSAFNAASGCPTQCSEAPMGACYCWCAALNTCPN